MTRTAAFRRTVFQVLAALAVGASGFASLGTSDCTEGYTVRAERPIDFAADESERLVRVRFSSSDFDQLVVTVEPGLELARIDPPPDPVGTGGLSGTAGAAASSPTHEVVERWDGDQWDYVYRVGRGDRVGAFSVSVEAALTGESCDGPPALDLRVDVVD